MRSGRDGCSPVVTTGRNGGFPVDRRKPLIRSCEFHLSTDLSTDTGPVPHSPRIRTLAEQRIPRDRQQANGTRRRGNPKPSNGLAGDQANRPGSLTQGSKPPRRMRKHRRRATGSLILRRLGAGVVENQAGSKTTRPDDAPDTTRGRQKTSRRRRVRPEARPGPDPNGQVQPGLGEGTRSRACPGSRPLAQFCVPLCGETPPLRDLAPNFDHSGLRRISE